ncbi:MAG TPA: hypothetical protein VJB14_15135, partial [Planctomycetota bacterium]|nr:hypothetical protein [Planctomycetota bacterium]
TAVVLLASTLAGTPRSGWEEARASELGEFAKVGSAYSTTAPLDLLKGGAFGAFQKYGSGTCERKETSLRLEASAAAVELHGPEIRNHRLRFQYAVEGERTIVDLRVSAGYREVTFHLPVDGSGAWREFEVVALEHLYRCTVDGAVNLGSTTANGTDATAVRIRLKVRGGNLLLRNASLEEIRGIPPQEAWRMLFSGDARGLQVPSTWKVENGELAGLGELRMEESWTDFEAELILQGRKGAHVSFGARGQPDLLRGEAVPQYAGDFSGFTFRVKGGTATLENERIYLTRTLAPGPGPLTLTVSGAPVRITSYRARPIR